MNYKGHLGVAVATAVIYDYFSGSSLSFSSNPVYSGLAIIASVLGARVPDWDLYLVPKEGKNDYRIRSKYHRQITHSLILIVALFLYSQYLIDKFNNLYTYLFLYFSIGLLSHIVADMITGTIPIFLWAKPYNKHLRLGISIKIVKTFFVNLGEIMFYILLPVSIIHFISYKIFQKDYIFAFLSDFFKDFSL